MALEVANQQTVLSFQTYLKPSILFIPIDLEKLSNEFAIRGVAVNWFESDLSNRILYGKVGVYKSEIETIKFVVPQANILGLTLFIMYNNDIHDNVDVEVMFCADDTTIIYEGITWYEVFENAEISIFSH